jgi:hypothetical protein
MKITVPAIIFSVLLDTPVFADKLEERKARRLDLNRKPRRLGSKHKNKASRAQNTPPKVTHFSLGSKNTHTGGSNNQDYDTNIVGGQQSAVGEFPYYGEYKYDADAGLLLHDTKSFSSRIVHLKTNHSSLSSPCATIISQSI